ncbi:MAG: DUF1351 domain-containing protein [Negativicutes bacterium]|nr:DUF1351 domain-containing protein [Negativicutes bacterium]
MAPRNKPQVMPDVDPGQQPAMELVVLENSLSFRWNFIEVKAALAEAIKKYHGLVVTDDNLPDMEKTQKEIAGLRIKLDKFCKETKNLLNEPGTKFDGEVKELLEVIGEAEKPIVEQLQKYEDARVAQRADQLAAFAQVTAGALGIREEYFKYEVPARLTNRSVSPVQAQKEIKDALNGILAKQGEDDAAKEETQRQQEIRKELARQRDGLVDVLCQTHSMAMNLKTPVVLADIQAILTDTVELAAIPDIVKSECKKRLDVELAVVADNVVQRLQPEAVPDRATSYTHPENCGCHNCLPGSTTVTLPPAVTSVPQTGGNHMPPPPVAPPWAGPPAAVAPPPPPPPQTELFEVVLRFPAISAVNCGALKMWLDEGGILVEVISQVPVKGA